MSKSAILDIYHGDFLQGFEVALEIKDNGQSLKKVQGKLPSAKEIPELYREWQISYLSLETTLRGKPLSEHAGHSQNLLKECGYCKDKLLAKFNEWLRPVESFTKLRDELVKIDKEPLQLILQTQGDILKKLPWQQWDLLGKDYLVNTEIALSAPEYQAVSPTSNMERIRILAILGNSEGIDVNADRELLEKLVTPYAEIDFRLEPQRTEITDRLWGQEWTILFFSGHSSSQRESGRIFINQKDNLSIEDLKHGLRNATQRGLQLAIFNSCDGLKLAESLAELHIPQTIVMREPIPDKVAQAFLKYFLQAFVNGETLYLSVRKARERLYDDGWEKKIPGCTWLPVIWQNPAVTPMSPPKKTTPRSSPFEEGKVYFEKGDFAKAFYWFSESAKQGDSRGMNNLGYLYLRGKEQVGVEKDPKLAFDWFHKAAEQGNADGQYNTGLSYENGRGVEKNDEQALSYYLKAAEQGFEKAQLKLLEQGSLYDRNGNPAKAIDWYNKVANQGNAEAQYRLGKMYLDGKGVKQDDKQATNWFEKAAKKDHPQSQSQLGDMYLKGKRVEQDYGKAFSYFMQAAKHGLADGQNGVGFMYLYGLGTKQDYPQASDYLFKAAVQGHADANFNLGTMYLNGWRIEQDDKKAFEYFQKAAQQEHAEGENWLGRMYQLGRGGISQDDNRASRWYLRAAEHGSASGQHNLGVNYEMGKGVDCDDKKAVEWYRKAAEQEHAYGQYRLAYMYEDGRGGLPLDRIKAHEYYRKAAEQFEKQETLAPQLLASMYENGKGVLQDYCKAADWYRKAINQGYPNLEEKLRDVQKELEVFLKKNSTGDNKKFDSIPGPEWLDLEEKLQELLKRAQEQSKSASKSAKNLFLKIQSNCRTQEKK